jgi:hypothetical protein
MRLQVDESGREATIESIGYEWCAFKPARFIIEKGYLRGVRITVLEDEICL